MNYTCIGDILRAPFLYMGIGFWMYSNRQIFDNVVLPLEFSTSTPRMDHKIIESIFYDFSPGTAFLFFLLIQIVLEVTMNMGIQPKFAQNPKVVHYLESPPDDETFYKTISKEQK